MPPPLRFFWLLISLLLIVSASGCYPAETSNPPAPTMPPAPTALPKPLDLTIIHTNDTWGYLLPCG